ncbi:MAG: hypothetical protein AB7O62_10135 [Pirellulales bacterium]
MSRETFINDVRRAVRMARQPASVRSDIWLTPRVVANFRENDFQDVDPGLLHNLARAVEQFRSAASRASSNGPSSDEQYQEGLQSLNQLEAAVHDIVAPEWTHAVHGMVDAVETWAKEQHWHVRRDSKMVTDTLLGTYPLPRLTIRTADHQFILEPITRFAPGSSGVVDILSVPSLHSVPVTRDEKNQWRLWIPENSSQRQPFDSRTFIRTLASLGQKEE